MADANEGRTGAGGTIYGGVVPPEMLDETEGMKTGPEQLGTSPVVPEAPTREELPSKPEEPVKE